jgi:hypothetical protein
VFHHLNCPLLVLHFKENYGVLTDVAKLPHIKFNENPLSGSPVLASGEVDKQI